MMDLQRKMRYVDNRSILLSSWVCKRIIFTPFHKLPYCNTARNTSSGKFLTSLRQIQGTRTSDFMQYFRRSYQEVTVWWIPSHSARIWKTGKLDCFLRIRLAKSASNHQNKDMQIHFNEKEWLLT